MSFLPPPLNLRTWQDKQELKGFLIGVKLLQNPLTRSQSGKFRGYEMIVENIDILFKEFDMVRRLRYSFSNMHGNGIGIFPP